jgi:hypothetical protein
MEILPSAEPPKPIGVIDEATSMPPLLYQKRLPNLPQVPKVSSGVNLPRNRPAIRADRDLKPCPNKSLIPKPAQYLCCLSYQWLKSSRFSQPSGPLLIMKLSLLTHPALAALPR